MLFLTRYETHNSRDGDVASKYEEPSAAVFLEAHAGKKVDFVYVESPFLPYKRSYDRSDNVFGLMSRNGE